MIKVIILDIDGTLTNHKKEITLETKEALLKAQARGIKLIIASGRPTSGLLEYGKILELDKNNGYYISFNGSQVVDATTHEILFNQVMDKEDVTNVLNHIKKFKVKPMVPYKQHVYVNDVYNGVIDGGDGRIFNVIEKESRQVKLKLCEIEDLAEFVDFDVNKILTAGDADYLKENYKEMMEPFKDKLSCMFTSNFYFEYTAKNIDKGSTIDKVLIPMGYKREEIMAFGDGQNDESMIELAGVGVAMGNAISSLKEKANYITLSNEEDGIAKALYHFLPEIY